MGDTRLSRMGLNSSARMQPVAGTKQESALSEPSVFRPSQVNKSEIKSGPSATAPFDLTRLPAYLRAPDVSYPPAGAAPRTVPEAIRLSLSDFASDLLDHGGQFGATAKDRDRQATQRAFDERVRDYKTLGYREAVNPDGSALWSSAPKNLSGTVLFRGIGQNQTPGNYERVSVVHLQPNFDDAFVSEREIRSINVSQITNGTKLKV